MEKYDAILKQQEEKTAAKLLAKHGIVCKQMPFGKEAPLYLAKPEWTNRFDPDRESTIGIFCAIWVAPKTLQEGKFSYNIHSKKIRELPGYKLTARKFADEFRELVKDHVADWPAIRLDYGPTNLLEGYDHCSLDDFAKRVNSRIEGFVSIHQEIDSLLDAARV